MKLVGVTGAIHHGKTSLADSLQNLEPASEIMESSGLISEVANKWLAKLETIPEDSHDLNAINNWLKAFIPISQEHLHTDLDWDDIRLTDESCQSDPTMYVKLFNYLEQLKAEPERIKTPIDADNKTWHRPLLQWMGGYFAIKSDGIWYREIALRAKQAETNGCQLFIASGLRFLSDEREVRKAGGIIIGVERPNAEELDIEDPTERERRQIHSDALVINDGNLEQLQICVGALWRDLKNSTLKKRYVATEEVI